MRQIKKQFRLTSFGRKASATTLKRYCDWLWATAVKLRDGHSCVVCGTTKYINAHHLISRMVYTTRWYIENGISLCAGCHKFRMDSAHHAPWILYDWLKVNRPEQYKWFIENRDYVHAPQSKKKPKEMKDAYERWLKFLKGECIKSDPKFIVRRNGFTEAEEDEIVTLYKANPNTSLGDAAKTFNTTKNIVCNILRYKGINTNFKGRRKSLKEVDHNDNSKERSDSGSPDGPISR